MVVVIAVTVTVKDGYQRAIFNPPSTTLSFPLWVMASGFSMYRNGMSQLPAMQESAPVRLTGCCAILCVGTHHRPR